MPRPKTLKIVGKTYKKAGAIEPAEYIQSRNMSFFEGNVVKYVSRHREKGGVKDLKKSIHYLLMIIEMDYGGEIPADFLNEFGKFYETFDK